MRCSLRVAGPATLQSIPAAGLEVGGPPGGGGGGEGWGLGQVLDPSSDLTCTPTLPSAGARHKHHLAGVVGVLVSPGCRLDRGRPISAARRACGLPGSSTAGAPHVLSIWAPLGLEGKQPSREPQDRTSPITAEPSGRHKPANNDLRVTDSPSVGENS